jgi:hypothetical protein
VCEDFPCEDFSNRNPLHFVQQIHCDRGLRPVQRSSRLQLAGIERGAGALFAHPLSYGS